jgi:methyl-accepting chemotaxis protein
MKIQHKLILSVFVSLIMIFGLSAVSYIEVRKINTTFDELVELPIPSILRLSALTETFLLSIEEAHSYRLYGLSEDKENYYAQTKEFDRLMDELKQDVHYGTPDIPPEDQELIDALSESVSRLRAAIDADFSRYEGMVETDLSAGDPFSQDKEEVVGLLRSYRDLEKEEIQSAHTEVNVIASRTLEIIVIVTGLFVLLTVIINGLFMRSILLPLRLLRDAAERLGKGDMSSRVETESRDELGMLADSFNLMAEHVREAQEILERKVKERTAELEKSKSGLEEMVILRTAELEKSKSELEQTVLDRTEEIQGKLAELEKTNAIMVGRELKMMELKQEIEALKSRSGGAASPKG